MFASFSYNVVVLMLHSFIYAVCLFSTLFLGYCAIKGTVFSGVFVLSPRSIRRSFICKIHLDDCITQ